MLQKETVEFSLKLESGPMLLLTVFVSIMGSN